MVLYSSRYCHFPFIVFVLHNFAIFFLWCLYILRMCLFLCLLIITFQMTSFSIYVDYVLTVVIFLQIRKVRLTSALQTDVHVPHSCLIILVSVHHHHHLINSTEAPAQVSLSHLGFVTNSSLSQPQACVQITQIAHPGQKHSILYTPFNVDHS